HRAEGVSHRGRSGDARQRERSRERHTDEQDRGYDKRSGSSTKRVHDVSFPGGRHAERPLENHRMNLPYPAGIRYLLSEWPNKKAPSALSHTTEMVQGRLTGEYKQIAPAAHSWYACRRCEGSPSW